jgi:hypothetical protein
MGYPHGGVCRVDSLAARAARAHYVNAKVFRLDIDFGFVRLGQYRDRYRRCVDSA